MSNLKTLIIGATFFGIAYATHKNDCLIIEKGETLCPDFVGCANAAPYDTSKSYSPQTNELIFELAKRNLTDESGKVHIYPVSCVMAKYILDNDINILMNTRITSIVHGNDGFDVEYFSNEGFKHVTADRIIDTLSIPFLKNGIDIEYKKYAAAVLFGGNEFVHVSDNDAVCKSGMYGESVLDIPVAKDCSYTDARAKLHSFISGRIQTSKIASFAFEFMYEFADSNIRKEIERGYIWAPSSSYNNLIDAFDGGVIAK